MKNIAYWLSLILIFVIPWENAFSVPGVGTGSKLVGLALAGFWGILVLSNGEFRKPQLFHYAVILFVGWSVASLLWSVDRETTKLQILTWVQLGGLVVILWDVLRTQREVRAALKAYVWGSFVTAIALIYNFKTGVGTEMDRFSVEGFNPNIVAVIISMAMPISWHLAMTTPPAKWSKLFKAFYYGFVPIALLAVLLTGSRGGLIGLVPAMVYVISNSPLKAPSIRIVLAGLFICGLMSAPFLLPENTQERLWGTYSSLAEGDMGGRGTTWGLAVPLFVEHPLVGIGVGAFESVHPTREAPHNVFLSVVVETGLVGLIALLVLLAASFNGALKQERPQRSMWIAVLLVLLLGTLVRNLEDRKQTWLVLALASTSAAVHVRRRREQEINVPAVQGETAHEQLSPAGLRPFISA